MEQIRQDNDIARGPLARIRHGFAEAIKWWAEHQAWPATDEIRIDYHRTTCGR